jgi:hypothetical protein
MLPVSSNIAKCLTISGWFGLLWLVLLVLVMLTAFWRLDEATRLIGSNLLIGALLVGSLIVVWLLPDPPRQKVAITAFVIIDAAVFLLSINAPAASGMTFGPAVTLMLSAAVWVGATSFFLALPGQQLGLPVTTLLFIGMGVFALIPGWFNGTRGTVDNHILRTATGAVPADADRLTLLDAFDRWRGCTGDGCPPKKMTIVAIEGGASRAAYWRQ